MLQTVPNGLREAYRPHCSKLVESLDSFDLSFLRDVLTLAVAARRPLKVEELRYALAMASKESRQLCNAYPLEDCADQNIVDRIACTCGSLIVVRGGVVSTTHFSVLEFLIGPEKSSPRIYALRGFTFKERIGFLHLSAWTCQAPQGGKLYFPGRLVFDSRK